MPLKDRQKRKEYAKKYRELRLDKAREYSRVYHKNHPKDRSEYLKKYYIENRISYLEKRRIATHELKQLVLKYYGNGVVACVLCGYNNIDALSIDHIDGSGAKHRRENRYLAGRKIYGWLIKNNFPDGYRTLCMNCQWVERVRCGNPAVQIGIRE